MNKVKLNLVGHDGNAFAILGSFKRAAIRDGWTQEEVKQVIDKCMSGDYDNLLATILEHCDSSDYEHAVYFHEDQFQYDEDQEDEDDDYIYDDELLT